MLSANGEAFSEVLALGFLAVKICRLQKKGRVYCAGLSVLICYSLTWESDRDPKHSSKFMIWKVCLTTAFQSISKVLFLGSRSFPVILLLVLRLKPFYTEAGRLFCYNLALARVEKMERW